MTQDKQRSDEVIQMRIFAWSRHYERRGFQEQLNKKAGEFLNRQGVTVKIMSAPQGAGASAEGLSMLIKILSFLVKLYPFLRNLQRQHFRRTYRLHQPKLTIMLEAEFGNRFDRNRRCSDLLFIARTLADYLRDEYPLYDFDILCNLTGLEIDHRLSLDIGATRQRPEDIGKLIKFLPKIECKENTSAHLTYGSEFLITLVTFSSQSNKSELRKYLPFLSDLPLY